MVAVLVWPPAGVPGREHTRQFPAQKIGDPSSIENGLSLSAVAPESAGSASRIFPPILRLQSSVDLLEQHIELQINDDSPRITNIGRSLRIFPGLLIVLESQVELCAFVPRSSKIGSQLHGTVQMLLAGG